MSLSDLEIRTGNSCGPSLEHFRKGDQFAGPPPNRGQSPGGIEDRDALGGQPAAYRKVIDRFELGEHRVADGELFIEPRVTLFSCQRLSRTHGHDVQAGQLACLLGEGGSNIGHRRVAHARANGVV
jgi:hypothetical protein